MRQAIRGLPQNVRLAWDLARRDVKARFGNSAGGLLWLVISPVSFTAVYWLVFGYILQLRWINPVSGEEVPYIAPLFAGLATYLLLADTIMGSLTTFRQKRDYVRRAAVPLWVLWLATLFRIGIVSSVNFAVLLPIGMITGIFTWSVLVFVPFALLLVIGVATAISLFLALIGAFFTDLDEISRILLRVAFYTAPITYPASVVPERLQGLLWINPLTTLAESVRNAFVFGLAPPPAPYLAAAVASAALLGLGYWLYTRLKGAVVDVV